MTIPTSICESVPTDLKIADRGSGGGDLCRSNSNAQSIICDNNNLSCDCPSGTSIDVHYNMNTQNTEIYCRVKTDEWKNIRSTMAGF